MTRVLIFTDVAQIAWSRTAGPYRVATALRNAGYETQVVEHFLWAALANRQYLWDAIERFVGADTLAVGFSITFLQQSLLIPEAQKLVRFGHALDLSILKESASHYAIPLQDEFLIELRERIRRRNPKTKLVIGGAAKARIDLTGTIFDAQVLGFADQSFPAYVKYLDGKNVFFQLNNGVIDYDQKADGFHVDHAILDWQDQDLMIEGERLPIEISRGCIFKCAFCGYALNGKRKMDYVKSMDVIGGELRRNYDRWGIRDYWFSDDTFNDTPEKVLGIHALTRSLPFDIRYRAYLRLDLLAAHKEVIEPLTESGLNVAMFGIESLNGANTKLVGKGMKPEKVVTMLDALWHAHGWSDKVFVLTCLMVGLPHDSTDNLEWLDTIRSEQFKADWINLNPLYLTAQPSELNASEFDKNAAQYGYEFTDGNWQWRNVNTGMTFADAQRIVKDTLAKPSGKNRTGTLHEVHDANDKASTYRMSRLLGTREKIANYVFSQRRRAMATYFERLFRL